MSRLFLALAAVVVLLHLAWIAGVLGGAWFTRHRPWWTAAHVLSLGYGIVIELVPVSCPLTALQQALELRAGSSSYQGSFLFHYVRLLDPSLPLGTLVTAAVAVCAGNLAVYAWRWNQASHRSPRPA